MGKWICFLYLKMNFKTFQNIDDVETNYVQVDDTRGKALLEQLLSQKSVCFDTETTGLDPRTAELIVYPFV